MVRAADMCPGAGSSLFQILCTALWVGQPGVSAGMTLRGVVLLCACLRGEREKGFLLLEPPRPGAAGCTGDSGEVKRAQPGKRQFDLQELLPPGGHTCPLAVACMDAVLLCRVVSEI
ncbi:hypothetical protein TREES_T100002959 [Tupaia chinensis]|uniref:Uncharacterized protein n=1 Tax=Tupaia chinensis TaxID=246437 RepID=L9KQ27_TUPCH|nr:hypothetical protein TREES_T100002959 [Tupaia chinensis]